MAPSRFKIDVPDDALDNLHKRLELARFPDELDNSQWDLGAPLSDIKRLVAYWKDGYDWRKHEAQLNEISQYITKVAVDGYGIIDVHFVHQVSPVENAIPLCFVHGWPGSFIEVTKLLPLLKGDGNNPAFHIVAPSLPNYAFSGGVKKRGFAIEKYAETCHKLMLQLGYQEYATQGGDWGFFITRGMGILYPNHCRASHINMINAGPPTFSKNPLLAIQHSVSPYSQKDRDKFARSQWFQKEGRGYYAEQSTKPQTLGYNLADSPVGCLAWIYEKLHDWTDSYPWTDDEILTWISIYWFSTAGPGASVRIYYESNHSSDAVTRDKTTGYVPNVKLAVAHFPMDLYVVPKLWGRTLGPVIYESEYPGGGHFAAYERPEAIAGDLNKMFKKGGPCFRLIKGKSGYNKRDGRANL